MTKKREKTRRKRREKMKEKMKREMKRRENIIFQNVSRPSNPPDESAQSVSKKHDSSSVFRAPGVGSGVFSGGAVLKFRWL